MKLANATVLITGANRGLGAAFAREALARGARKVYAAARDPDSVTVPGVVPIRLDVTKPAEIAAAARECNDVTLLINNAGIAATGGFLADASLASAQRHLDTNFFGPLRMTQAFAPVLAAHGGGAIVNVLSIASWINGPLLGVYGMSKSAAWAMTNGVRTELREQRTQVLALHVELRRHRSDARLRRAQARARRRGAHHARRARGRGQRSARRRAHAQGARGSVGRAGGVSAADHAVSAR